MPATLAESLSKRWNQMLQYQATARSLWQDLGDYINVRRSFIIGRKTEGASQTTYLYDSTAPKANDDLAAFISGTLTNMAMQWFGLRVDDENFNNDVETGKWLDQCSAIIYKYLRSSNFNTEIQEAYKDLGAFGTACLLLEEMLTDGKFTGFLFRAEAIGSYAISENADGTVDTVFRRLVMPGEACLDKWGMQLHEKTRERISKNPDDKINIVHAVFPKGRMAGVTSVKDPFASVYFEEDLKHKLSVAGYKEHPFFVPRWAKTAGEMYGRGPGHTALPDILSLNKALELTLIAWAKAANPPMLALDDAILGNVQTIPDGITWTRTLDGLKVLESKGRFDVNAQLVADVRRSIKDIFFANQFTLPDKSIITATEVERRLELMQQVLGPVVGRLEYELLSPCISRCFRILQRNGKLPPPPQKFALYAQKNGGVDLTVAYEGPLSRAQRNSDVKATSDVVTFVTALSEIYPAGKDNIDWDELIVDRAMKSGLPKKYIVDKTKRDRQRAQEQEAQAQAQQAALQESQAKTMQANAGAMQSLGATDMQNLQGAMDGTTDTTGAVQGDQAGMFGT